MSNYVISLIRTWVPIIVGALLTWLAATFDFVVDESTAAGGVAFITAVVSGIYYGVVRLVERRYPQIGILLGKITQPGYAESNEDPPIAA